jgi:hypothetical protein
MVRAKPYQAVHLEYLPIINLVRIVTFRHWLLSMFVFVSIAMQEAWIDLA